MGDRYSKLKTVPPLHTDEYRGIPACWSEAYGLRAITDVNARHGRPRGDANGNSTFTVLHECRASRKPQPSCDRVEGYAAGPQPSNEPAGSGVRRTSARSYRPRHIADRRWTLVREPWRKNSRIRRRAAQRNALGFR